EAGLAGRRRVLTRRRAVLAGLALRRGAGRRAVLARLAVLLPAARRRPVGIGLTHRLLAPGGRRGNAHCEPHTCEMENRPGHPTRRVSTVGTGVHICTNYLQKRRPVGYGAPSLRNGEPGYSRR